MVGIVVVSHSPALAEAAVKLASEMVAPDARPKLACAAGVEGGFGTDAAAIAEAVERVDDPDGVLMLLDLGSAILSAEMACEFLDPDLAARTRLSPAPLVEGLVAAVVTAATGASLDEVDAEARAGLRAKADHLRGAETEEPAEEPDPPAEPRLTFRHRVRNPHGLHARPAAVLVAGLRGLDARVWLWNETSGAGPARASSLTRVAGLGLRMGDELAAAFEGPDAVVAEARLAELAAGAFGEDTAGAAEASPDEPTPACPTGTGQQVVVGVARPRAGVDVSGYVAGPPAVELSRLRAAVGAAKEHLARLAERHPRQAEIFWAQAAMLGDAEWAERAESAITDGASAVGAVHHGLAEVAAVFAALPDPYLRDRAEDARGLERLVASALVGAPLADDGQGPDAVWILEELDAAIASTLSADNCAGVITTSGGATGHGVIVAQARGVACLTGCLEAADVADGQVVAFDPMTKRLWIDPPPEQLADLRALADERAAAERLAGERAHEPASTRSGRRVLVEANVASLADARAGMAAGAEGSGLVRTEILFGELAHAPDAESQAEAFVSIADALGGEQITIRTWDVGGDKPLPFLALPSEPNPFLGERGIRAMRSHPELLTEQLRACLLAAESAKVRVMFPMVTEPDELVWAVGLLEEARAELGAGPIPVGMMVEVPAAAIRAVDFASLVDFVSVGSNDLAQYTGAADRGLGRVAHLARGDSPAVLDLIAMTRRALPDVPLAVCGDLASQAAAVPALVGLGVDELSVRPGVVGLVKQAVREAP